MTPWKFSILAALAALSLAGCESLSKLRPSAAPPPAPAAAGQAAEVKSGAVAKKDSRPLFVIGRNKNANVIHYEANLDPDGELNPKWPVIAYWVLHAEDGRRKKLNWLEKKKAYGIKIKPASSRDGYTLTLAAAPWMPMAVRKAGDAVHVEAKINGRTAVLERMFIQDRDKLLGPKVEYIELFGKDLLTGEACSEKILPR